MDTKNLHKAWLNLGQKHCQDIFYLESLWNEIEKKYSEKSRHYHNLNHIQAMLKLAEENKKDLIDVDVVLFAIWFHDIIYKSSSKSNEEKSAEFAKDSLKEIGLETSKIEKVYQLIISTKAHKIIVNDNDNNYLLDFDLAILGQDWEVYQHYIKNIRKEYKIYPDFLYNPGRKKVLKSFLKRGNLFFTEKYQALFEEKARENLTKEIKLLS